MKSLIKGYRQTYHAGQTQDFCTLSSAPIITTSFLSVDLICVEIKYVIIILHTLIFPSFLNMSLKRKSVSG